MSDPNKFYRQVRRPRPPLTHAQRHRIFWAAVIGSVVFIAALWAVILPTQLRESRVGKSFPWIIEGDLPEVKNFEESLVQLRRQLEEIKDPPAAAADVELPPGLAELPEALQQKGEKLITDHTDETAQPQE